MRRIIFIFIVYAFGFLKSQTIINEPIKNPDWEKPYPAFRIVGNIYYVGTYELASYLIVTSKGNILINTGSTTSYPLIKNNIESLGFAIKDIKILLLTQAHYDHTGVMAMIKKESGAKLLVDDKDAEVLQSGGKSDYELGKYGVTFEPVTADKLLQNGDKIRLGNTVLTMLHHPGHTKGSCSFLLNTKDEQRNYKVLIANMPTIITDRKFSEIKDYPTIQQDYADTFKSMRKIKFDLWMTAHTSQFDLHKKRKEKDLYNPKLFMDTNNYHDQLNALETIYLQKIETDAQSD